MPSAPSQQNKQIEVDYEQKLSEVVSMFEKILQPYRYDFKVTTEKKNGREESISIEIKIKR